MNLNDKNNIQSINSTLIGWRLSGANNAMAQHIATRMIIEEKQKVRITINDFIFWTNYSRQSIVDAIRYLSDRSIIFKELDVTDNKGYLYSLIIYEMNDKEKVDGIMSEYKKNGNGFGNWKNSSKEKEAVEFNKKYCGVDVGEWNYDDFSFFIYDFIKHCAKDVWNFDISDVYLILNSSFRRNQTFVNIVDYLNSNSGGNFCKLMLKAYLQWCIEGLFRNIVNNELKPIDGVKQFSIGHLSRKEYMNVFLEEHGIHKDLKSVLSVEKKLSNYRRVVTKKEEVVKSVHFITLADMREYYKLGGVSSLLIECGIVLTGNYLIDFENKSKVEAAKEIGDFLNGMNLSHDRQKKSLKSIVEKTCVGSPYHSSMSFLNWFIIYEDVFKKLGKSFDRSGFQITKNKSRNSYSFFTDKETLSV